MKSIATLLTLAILPGSLLAGDWTPSAKSPGSKDLVPLAGPIPEGNCLSYDFLDLEYGINDFGTAFQTDGDFVGVGFSKSLGSSFFFTGSYADGGFDLIGVNAVSPVDTQRYRFGLGVRHSIAPCVDLTFEGGGDHLDAEFPVCHCLDYDTWGYYFGPGIRARSGRFEMFAKALFTAREGDAMQDYLGRFTSEALSADEEGWLFSPGIIYHVTERLGVKVAAEFGENDNAFTFGARYEF